IHHKARSLNPLSTHCPGSNDASTSMINTTPNPEARETPSSLHDECSRPSGLRKALQNRGPYTAADAVTDDIPMITFVELERYTPHSLNELRMDLSNDRNR